MNVHPQIAAHLVWGQAKNWSQSTLTARRNILGRLARDVDLDHATSGDLAAWLAALNLTAKSRAVYHGHLRGFYRWRKAAEFAVADPMAILPAPRVPLRPPSAPPSEEVVQAILASVVEPWRTAVLLARYQGFRCLEVAAARREHVTATTFRVTGKGGRVDDLPTHPRVWEAMRDRPPGELATRDGGPMTAGEVSRGWRSYAISRGLPVLGLHRFRHGYCDRLRRAGVDVRVIQTLMRHRDIGTTMRYMHVDEDEQRAALALI